MAKYGMHNAKAHKYSDGWGVRCLWCGFRQWLRADKATAEAQADWHNINHL